MNHILKKLEQEYSTQNPNLHTISILTSNKPGVLSRISMIFSRRGYNINSVVCFPTRDGDFSWLTLTTEGNQQGLKQILKQLGKLIDIIQVIKNPKNTMEKSEALNFINADEVPQSPQAINS